MEVSLPYARILGLFLGAQLLAACGGSTDATDGGPGDAADDAGHDASHDAGEDAGEPDAGTTRWEPTGAAAWYAADFVESLFNDGDGTILAEDGDPVRRWADLMQNEDADGRTGSTAITRTSIGGRPSLLFDGAAYWCPNGDIARNVPAISIVAIYHPTASDNSADLWAASTATSTHVRATLFRNIAGDTNKGTGGRRLDADGFAGAADPAPLTDGETHVSIGVLNYAEGTIDLYVDGSEEPVATGSFASSGNTSDTDSHNVWIGTKHELEEHVFYGHFHELVIYQRAISEDEIAEIAAHARDHWGVTLVD
jgi:hypothetical protein